MPPAAGRDKRLPIIPVDMNDGRTVVEDQGPRSVPSLRVTACANTNKVLPRINAENVLSEEDVVRLHELWNGAGLSARRRRRDRREPLLIPPPIFIPEPGHLPPTLSVPSADPSITSAVTTPTSGTRKRRGFLSARISSGTREEEKKTPSALEKLRAMAQNRLKKKLRCAKSAPNLGDQVVSCRRRVALHRAEPSPIAPAPGEIGFRISKPPKPEMALQQEDMDESAIYFTMDPNWRTSWGSAELVPITAIPDSANSLDRLDSPLLHRQHSLDQLSPAAVHATNTLPASEYPSAVLHPIDELHAFLEL